MSAADRAEARRKAILSKGTNRLAKLTTSARGADAPAYMHDDPALPNLSRTQNDSEGQESPKPPTHTSPSPSSPSLRPTRASNADTPFTSPGFPGASPDPSAWSEEQQQQLLQALMGRPPNPSSHRSQPPLPPFSNNGSEPRMPGLDNPLVAMFSSFQQGGDASPQLAEGPAEGAVAQPTTRLQKLMPLVHLISVWGLLGYFVLYKEPTAYEGEDGVVGVEMWRRWAELARRSPAAAENTGVGGGGWGVHVVSFFWAFTTLQIALHSVRIFSGFDAIQPPMLLALALPHLPPPFPSIIVNTLKYFQMGSMFLDDLAALLVGIGFIVFFTGWFT